MIAAVLIATGLAVGLALLWLFKARHKGVVIGKLLRITPGGRHAWYESSIGPLRKRFV
jgi:hypothetical protein